MKKVPCKSAEEKEFQQAVWSLCQQVKDLDTPQMGQFVPDPLF
jgi:hypothetical protein